MRIALVCPYAWDRVGGVQSHVRSLAAALRDRGHETMVIAPRSVGSEPATEPGVAVAGRAVAVPANGSIAPIAPGPDALVATRSALARFDPDVVHIHEPMTLSASLFALLSARAPTVGTFHAAAHSNVFYQTLAPVLRRLAERITVRTAVSEAALALAARYLPGEYVLTPNGVDVERFARAAEARPREPAVLFLGRLEPRKGLDVLIRAMTRLHDLAAALVVAGSGPKEGDWRTLADDLGVRARWLGRLSDDELPDVYASASVYCHPATRRESFGIVLLEAMAAGRPVVCSDLPGFRAAAGDAALYFPARDAAALARHLRLVLTNDAEARALAGLGRARAETFDWRRLAGEVEEIYARASGDA